ncbi:MAG: hypothetical protein CMJ19_02845 [Phycisphaeraceae bacterium]|nr:hypothetical protein [Phycisphaeraceae bacterium]
MKILITLSLLFVAVSLDAQLLFKNRQDKKEVTYEEAMKWSGKADSTAAVNDSISTANINDKEARITSRMDSIESTRKERQRAHLLAEESKPSLTGDDDDERSHGQDKNINSDQAKWEKKMISKYGSNNGTKIINHKVEFGFTKQMCKEALGDPYTVNRTQTAGGVDQEQWVYRYTIVENYTSRSKSRYLYFEKGKLVGKQNFPD